MPNLAIGNKKNFYDKEFVYATCPVCDQILLVEPNLIGNGFYDYKQKCICGFVIILKVYVEI